MLDHHLQKKILAQLVEAKTARYADLKPKDIEGNVFTYHLQMLTKQQLIHKNEEGHYELTSKGKLMGINATAASRELLSQAHAILLLCVRDKQGRWLLRRRLVEPMHGKIGFIHGEPHAYATINEAAEAILERRTGLIATFEVAGSGYVRLFDETELVAFSQFTLLTTNNATGTLKERDSHGENSWHEMPDFSGDDMIPSMPAIVEALSAEQPFLLDLRYDL